MDYIGITESVMFCPRAPKQTPLGAYFSHFSRESVAVVALHQSQT